MWFKPVMVILGNWERSRCIQGCYASLGIWVKDKVKDKDSDYTVIVLSMQT